MSAFGALTDHFALTAASAALETVGELVDSNETPIAQTRVDANDENNDIAATAYHGNTEGDLSEVSCTYAIKSGTVNLNTLVLGEIEVSDTKIVITAIDVTTSNGEWPQITVSGTKGTEAITAPTGKLNTFTLPSITIGGRKQAQVLNFTVGEGRLTGSSIAAACELAQQDDGVGEPVAHGVSGATIELSADFVRITLAPAWTLSAPWTQTQSPSLVQGQAAWHTSTGTASGTIERDDEP